MPKLQPHRFKIVGPPASNEDLDTFIKNCKSLGMTHPAIPEELESLWRIGSEWHLVEEHYNVFGFNIYNPKEIIQITGKIFGGEEIKQEWASEIQESNLFGATRHMVNNCNIDEELTAPPASNFITYVESNLENWNEDEEIST
ncbi:unnamed protein product [Rhizopus microsporus]